MSPLLTARLTAWREVRTQWLVYLALPLALAAAQALEPNRRAALELLLTVTTIPLTAVWLGLGRQAAADRFWAGLGGSPTVAFATRASIQLAFVLGVGALSHSLLVVHDGLAGLPLPLASVAGRTAWIAILASLWAAAAAGRQFAARLGLVLWLAGVVASLALSAQVGFEVGNWALLDGLALRAGFATAVLIGLSVRAVRWSPWAAGLRPLDALAVAGPMLAVGLALLFGAERVAPNAATGELVFADASPSGEWAMWSSRRSAPWGARRSVELTPDGRRRGPTASRQHGVRLWDDGRAIWQDPAETTVRFADGHTVRCPAGERGVDYRRARWSADGSELLIPGWGGNWRAGRSGCESTAGEVAFTPRGEWTRIASGPKVFCQTGPGKPNNSTMLQPWALLHPDGRREEFGTTHVSLGGDHRLAWVTWRPGSNCERGADPVTRFVTATEEHQIEGHLRLAYDDHQVCSLRRPNEPLCWAPGVDPIPLEQLRQHTQGPRDTSRRYWPLRRSDLGRLLDRDAGVLTDAASKRRWDVSDFIAPRDPEARAAWFSRRGARYTQLRISPESELLWFTADGTVEVIPPLD